uniref:Uncharacterized protein n=1 Tax=Panagrolaimus sp. ES5 TaxID=591445 RepID=A0AC34F5A5_9BILA
MLLRSIIRLGPKFIRTKDYVFEDKSSIKPNFVKTWCIVAVSFTIGSVLLVNFAVPTPDIQFDVKYYTSPDFKQYVDSNGSDMILSRATKNAVLAYYRDSEDAKFYTTMLDYRSSFTEEP